MGRQIKGECHKFVRDSPSKWSLFRCSTVAFSCEIWINNSVAFGWRRAISTVLMTGESLDTPEGAAANSFGGRFWVCQDPGDGFIIPAEGHLQESGLTQRKHAEYIGQVSK